MAFIASSFRVTEEKLIIRNCTVRPTLFLLNIFTALKGTNFYINAAGVVLCGSPKRQPHRSYIVQFIFFFWSSEHSGIIIYVKSESIIGLDPCF